MKIVVNTCYGGFSLPETFCEKYEMDRYDNISRTDERLINFVENFPNNCEFFCTQLEIVEIPDESTDWQIDEYDGLESIIYVLNGKIHWE